MSGDLIGFNVDGLYIRCRGPFPREVLEAAHDGLHFRDRQLLIAWLNMAFPGWRKHVEYSENL